MKNFTLLFCLTAFSIVTASAQYSTGTVNLFTTAGLEYSAKIDVDATLVTLTLTGPDTRWLGIGFGTNSMAAGNDVVIFNGTTLSDRTFDGVGVTPAFDAGQSWTVTSNTVSSGVRTVTGTRALDTGEPNDYIFSNSASGVDLVFARGESLTVGYHGFGNCGTTSANFTLGTETFSLRSSQIFPNPSTGAFAVRTNTSLEQINIYTLTGTFVKTIEVEDNDDNVEVNISGLQTGVYLIELQNDSEKSWKKVVVN